MGDIHKQEDYTEQHERNYWHFKEKSPQSKDQIFKVRVNKIENTAF